MSEMLLITQSGYGVNGIDGHSYKVDAVVGIVVPGLDPQYAAFHRDNGREEVTKLVLENNKICSIANFFVRTSVQSGDSNQYNCHTFGMQYQNASQGELPRHNYMSRPLSDVHQTSLKAGKLYTTLSGGEANHSLVGINDPRRSLSIMGNLGVLALADNRTIMRMHMADKIVPAEVQRLQRAKSAQSGRSLFRRFTRPSVA